MNVDRSAIWNASGIIPLLFSALGYFVYGGLDGAFAIFILCMLFEFTILFAFVPFIGIVIYYWVMAILILPSVIIFTGITETWLTGFIFWLNVCVGIVICVKTSIWMLNETPHHYHI